MSPEQAKGSTVDKRTDIWAFGCVLYEMLTRRAAFGGDTMSDTIAKILEREPDWAALPAATPPSIRRLLSRCLLKNVKQRLRDIGDARADIEEACSSPSTLSGVPESAAARENPTTRRLMRWVAIGGVATAATLAALYLRTASVTMSPHVVSRLTMPFTTVAPLTTFVPIALSPDGRQVVYRVDGNLARLYIRPLDGFDARPLPGTEGDGDPFFSPGGQRVGFVTEDEKLKWVPIAGGAPQTICDLPVAGWSDGSEWQPDDSIVFSSKTLRRVAASGGTPQPVTKLDEKKGEMAHRWPQILPGGKVVLFTVQIQLMEGFHIALESLETHTRSDLLQQRVYARYASSGHLIYAEAPGYFTGSSSGSLLASAFDPERLTVTGSERRILDGVWVSGNGSAQFALSTTGTLVYALRGLGRPRTLVWVDRQGRPTPFRLRRNGITTRGSLLMNSFYP
jgi:serine/threonine-protein kinase